MDQQRATYRSQLIQDDKLANTLRYPKEARERLCPISSKQIKLRHKCY